MATWEIKGEAGATLDDTVLTLEAAEMYAVVISFASTDADKFSFKQRFKDINDASNIDIGQIVELYRDGVRFFRGNVTSREAEDTEEGYMVKTIVDGPWWWLKNTPFSGEVVDGTGETLDRMFFNFDEDDLKTTLTTSINRAITLGCDLSLGTISTCFDIPIISVANKSCADVIIELMRWIPDAVTWFDYSAATPSLNITRRGSATTLTMAAGGAPITSTRITPKLELEVEQVRILYAEFDTDQNLKFIELSSGDSGTAQAGGATTITLASTASKSDDAYNSLTVTIDSGTGSGQSKTITDYVGSTKVATVNSAWTTNPDATSVYTVGSGSGTGTRPSRQIIAVSGPEVNDVLPKDYFESSTIKTISIGDSCAEEIFGQFDPALRSVGYTASSCPNVMCGSTFGESHYGPGTLTNYSSPRTVQYTAKTYPRIVKTITGDDLPAGYDYALVTGTPKEWWADYGIVPISCTAKATLRSRASKTFSGDDAWDSSSSAQRELFWDNDFDDGGQITSDYRYISGGLGIIGAWFYIYEASVNFIAINANYNTQATLYRKQDYSFINPPADMASSLQGTQNWTPYEGDINIIENDIGGVNYFDKKINLSNSLTEHATMGALPTYVTHDISNYRTTVNIGAPDRLDYRGLVRKFRQTGRSNIIYT